MYGYKPNLKYNMFPSLWHHILWIWHHVPILMMSHSHPCDSFSCSHLSQHSFYHSGHSHPYTPTKSCTLAPLPEPAPYTPTHATLTLGHVGVTSIPPHHMPHGATSSICHIDATLVPYHVMPSDKSRPSHHVPPWTSTPPHYNYPTSFKTSLHLILDMNNVLLKTKFNLQGRIAWNQRVSSHSI